MPRFCGRLEQPGRDCLEAGCAARGSVTVPNRLRSLRQRGVAVQPQRRRPRSCARCASSSGAVASPLTLAGCTGVATAAERQALTSESVTHARAALTLDVTEGRHWYQLGLALMAQAFGTGSASSSDLAPAAKAFAHAVQRGEGERNADLLFNRAVLLRYLDELQGALDSFRASGRLDPALPWQAQTQALLRDATRVHVLVAARGHTRPKRYAAAAAQVAATPLPAGVLAPTLTALTPGMNGGCALGCMVLAMASAPGAMPAVAVAVDGAGICFAITAYGLRDSALREGLPVALLAPLLTHVRVAAPDGELAYALVRVEGALGMRCLQRGAWEAPTSQAESPSVTFSV